jgi:predicted Fe-S protein YdhL (DUF1289 family)
VSTDTGGDTVASPCVGVCTLDPQGRVCVGCGRLIEEIGQWSSASQARRAQIVDAARRRLQDLATDVKRTTPAEA